MVGAYSVPAHFNVSWEKPVSQKLLYAWGSILTASATFPNFSQTLQSLDSFSVMQILNLCMSGKLKMKTVNMSKYVFYAWQWKESCCIDKNDIQKSATEQDLMNKSWLT